jgi:predicted ATPase
MIDTIEASNFKCLSGLEFRVGPLTLLTGTNSVGKSSVLQSILLMRLAVLKADTQPSIISLNGPYGLNLGEFADILRHDLGSDASSEIKLSITESGELFSVSLTADEEAARYAHYKFERKAPPSLTKRGLGHFTYLSSDRLGPQNTFEIQSVPKEFLEIGFRGDYAADVLYRCERDEISPLLEHPKASGQRLLKQVEAWLSEFVPGVEIRVEPAPDMDLAALRFKRGGISSEWERPGNTGFGVSYCLSIVLAGLVGRQGSILIVESPEAHLHPSAQSAMGSFLGRLATVGIQVFVETHSDHILNGIRRAAVEKEHPLNRESVVINHLSLFEGKVTKREIGILESGALSSHPTEFFDQAELDLSAIVKSRFPAIK